MKHCVWPLVALLLGLAVPKLPAQQMIDYTAINEPYLLLLREPAVHKDLGLTAEQSAALNSFNERRDSDLLALRNQAPEQGEPKLRELIEATRQEAARVLTGEQEAQLEQIVLRVRGLPCLLLPSVANELKLSAAQQQTIRTAVGEFTEQMKDLRERAQQGESLGAQEVVRLRRRQHQQIIGVLTRDQQMRLVALLGRSFDVDQLGRLRFKAPELVGGPWIGSEPLKLSKLRGKVVALHFYAFG